MKYIALVFLLAVPAFGEVKVKCGAYGRLVQCQEYTDIKVVPKWEVTLKGKVVMTSDKDKIQFKVRGKGIYKITLDFQQATFIPVHIYAKWIKEDGVWKVMFARSEEAFDGL